MPLGVVRSRHFTALRFDAVLTRENVAALRRHQRAIVFSAIRVYHTVSYEVACLLAGAPPWDLEAEAFIAGYRWRSDFRSRGKGGPGEGVIRARRLQSQRSVTEALSRLVDPPASFHTVEVVSPVLVDWVGHSRAYLTLWLTQMLTAHGCFDRYSHKIVEREPMAQCSADRNEEPTLARCSSNPEQHANVVLPSSRGSIPNINTASF